MTSKGTRIRLELTDELPQWKVTLLSGDIVTVAAHGWGRVDELYTFSALMVGKPHFEVPLVIFPQAAVAQIRSV